MLSHPSTNIVYLSIYLNFILYKLIIFNLYIIYYINSYAHYSFVIIMNAILYFIHKLAITGKEHINFCELIFYLAIMTNSVISCNDSSNGPVEFSMYIIKSANKPSFISSL